MIAPIIKKTWTTYYLSKTIERVAISQANNDLDIIKAHTTNQSGYKPYHSFNTLLLRVSYDVLNNMDSSNGTKALLLDLSATFDTKDHDLLLEILWFDLGLSCTVYKWFKDFLWGRKQAMCRPIDGEKSEFRENKSGMPQGSVDWFFSS